MVNLKGLLFYACADLRLSQSLLKDLTDDHEPIMRCEYNSSHFWCHRINTSFSIANISLLYDVKKSLHSEFKCIMWKVTLKCLKAVFEEMARQGQSFLCRHLWCSEVCWVVWQRAGVDAKVLKQLAVFHVACANCRDNCLFILLHHRNWHLGSRLTIAAVWLSGLRNFSDEASRV